MLGSPPRISNIIALLAKNPEFQFMEAFGCPTAARTRLERGQRGGKTKHLQHAATDTVQTPHSDPGLTSGAERKTDMRMCGPLLP